MYEVFEGDGGQWFWRLKAGNGEIVAQSEGYETKEHAEEGVTAAIEASRNAASQELAEFHSRDGFYFKRLADGSVRVRYEAVSIELTANEWASVVASMSAVGEDLDSFNAALALHSA